MDTFSGKTKTTPRKTVRCNYMNEIILEPEQREAVEQLVPCHQQVQTLGGYAGTGKTTVINTLVRRLPGFAVCAFTGKATQVLRRKGVQASTIHSLIYHAVPQEDGGVSFELLMDAPFEGVIVDEGSMVPEALHNDLLSFGVPIIYVGDHGQLPPVGASSFNMMANPDVRLEKIHRNAGEIAAFANHLRQGGDARQWASTMRGQVKVIESTDLEHVDIGSSDQMICAYNRTRVQMNEVVRAHLGYPVEPVVGDRIMCLQNDKRQGIFNGMQGKIISIRPDRSVLCFQAEQLEANVRYAPEAFGSEKAPPWRRGIIPFDYAYCVTCHKAQGDEWDRVIVIEQRCTAWEHARWAYTAASRAKDDLIWVLE